MTWLGYALACLFMFGSPAAYGIIRSVLEHKERMQEKRNEELRLQIQLEQARNERFDVPKAPISSDPLPKDAPWDEQVQSSYEMGYQQMRPQQ